MSGDGHRLGSGTKLVMSDRVRRAIHDGKKDMPVVMEFAYLKQHLQEETARSRATHLLDCFKAMRGPVRDIWYGQLDDLYAVAEALHDDQSMQLAEEVTGSVRATHPAVSKDERCMICLEAIETKSNSVRCSGKSWGGAQHTFHRDCAESSRATWGPQCPLCRDEVLFEEETHAEVPYGLCQDDDLVKQAQELWGVQSGILAINVADADGDPCFPSAIDPVSFLSDAGLADKLNNNGYSLESKRLGKRHAVPSKSKLAGIKSKCVDAVKTNCAFVDALQVYSREDLCSSFVADINADFSLELFHEARDEGLSHADVYTFLPFILKDKADTCQPELTMLKEVYEAFAEFRDVFGLMYNPLEDYLAIFQAICNLLSHVDAASKLLQGIQKITTALLRTLFAAVLDIIATMVWLSDSRPFGRLLQFGGGASVAAGLGMVALAALAAPEGGVALAALKALNIGRCGILVAGTAAFGAGSAIAQKAQGNEMMTARLSNKAGQWRIFALSHL